jgi:hypothetical protein
MNKATSFFNVISLQKVQRIWIFALTFWVVRSTQTFKKVNAKIRKVNAKIRMR